MKNDGTEKQLAMSDLTKTIKKEVCLFYTMLLSSVFKCSRLLDEVVKRIRIRLGKQSHSVSIYFNDMGVLNMKHQHQNTNGRL